MVLMHVFYKSITIMKDIFRNKTNAKWGYHIQLKIS